MNRVWFGDATWAFGKGLSHPKLMPGYDPKTTKCFSWWFKCTYNKSKMEYGHQVDKNSSGDEIANVNIYAVRPESYPNSMK